MTGTDGTPLLELRGLGRDFGGGGWWGGRFGGGPSFTALDDVSMTVGRAEIVGIVGESGSGKSTLARLAMALDRPSRGAVLFEGADLNALEADELRRRRRDFQMVFQDPRGSLDPRMRVGRVVAEPLHVLEPRPGLAERRRLVEEMLAAVGLPAEAMGRYPHEFSGGQRQRIAIARALITRPKLVVADEPVSALDLSVQAQVINLILDLRDRFGVGFLFVSHDLAVVDCLADRVGVMYLGRLVEIGPAHALFDRPLHPYTRLLAGARSASRSTPGPTTGSGGGSGSAASDGTTAGGCAFAPRCPLADGRCRSIRPRLGEDAGGRRVACHHPLDG